MFRTPQNNNRYYRKQMVEHGHPGHPKKQTKRNLHWTSSLWLPVQDTITVNG